jgi:NAD(P)-dependent dehydrogenase (short-subunit alcohol dehydrogenase family)
LRFDGQVAIVTGAGRGLGRAHALGLAQRGASVVVNDVGGVGTEAGPTADRVVAEIEQAGGSGIPSYDSVASPEGGRALVARAVDHFGSLDILINNAGFLRNALFAEMTIDEFDAVLDVHLRAAFLVTQSAWHVMQKKGYGRVVMTSSSSGLFGRKGGANYCAAKAGIVGLTRALALEDASSGIRVYGDRVGQPPAIGGGGTSAGGVHARRGTERAGACDTARPLSREQRVPRDGRDLLVLPRSIRAWVLRADRRMDQRRRRDSGSGDDRPSSRRHRGDRPDLRTDVGIR